MNVMDYDEMLCGLEREVCSLDNNIVELQQLSAILFWCKGDICLVSEKAQSPTRLGRDEQSVLRTRFCCGDGG